MEPIQIGIFGGSGLYNMAALENRREHQIITPYGEPSGPFVSGTLDGVGVVFLARHGPQHHLLPSEVPYAANVFAMKQLGVRYLLSVSAVGSLQEDMPPLDMVVPDQYLDFTKQRRQTFFGQGVVGHVSMAQPICPALAELLHRSALEVAHANGFNVHPKGSYVCIEGPQFSSLAESLWYRSLGASIIGMTNMPEAKLAREAQMAYASLAMVTDFDCWHPKEAQVTASLAIANLMKNAERASQIVAKVVAQIAAHQPPSIAHKALAEGLVTPLEAMDATTRERIEVLLR